MDGKELSYMMAVPKNVDDIMDADGIFERLENISDAELISRNVKQNKAEIDVVYKGVKYTVQFYVVAFNMPQMYRIQHLFPDLDAEAVENTEVGLGFIMEFSDNYLDSYHLQLKIIDAAVPEKLAVFDDSSEKVLSGKWAAMAAKSVVPPAPRYIYTVQAVLGENDSVWLHTHGLNRCGITELEILDSSKDTYNIHYNVIETMANRMLELDEPLEEMEPMFLARLSRDNIFVTTIVPWEKAVEMYKDDIIGGKKDRTEGHSENTHVIFVYNSEEDFKSGNIRPVTDYTRELDENLIYMVTNAETARMAALARERVEYLYKAVLNDENKALVKIALDVDDEYRDENNSKEHIWFLLKSFENGMLTCELTQEPYYVSGMHEGSTGTYGVNDVTDWIIYAPEYRITPDDVYLMELECGRDD